MGKVVSAAACLLFLVTGCGEPPQINAAVRVNLRYPLIEDFYDSKCAGALDYKDIQTGTAVTFRDADGRIVGTTKLQKPQEASAGMECVWAAKATLKSDSKFFTAELGGWTSAPATPRKTKIAFRLQSWKPAQPFGREAQVDPTWARAVP